MFIADKLRRHASLAIAAVLAVAALVPAFVQQRASAYNLVTSRSIELSSSADGSIAAGQNVIYKVGFTTGSTHDIQSVAVEFCSNSPIIGDSCTAPSGFDVNETNLTVNNQSGLTGFSIHANTTTNRVVLTRASTGNISSGTAVSFELGNNTNGITNPTNVNTTFYGRIYTYTTNNGTGAETDAGGVALSTAEQITVTSKVQERLIFCVYTTGAGNDCTGKSGSAVTLGDSNGVLDPSGPYVDKSAQYSVTTNASGNVAIRLRGTTLTSGIYTISPIGASQASATTGGSEQFGLCTYQSAGSGLSIAALYDGTGGSGTCSSTTQSAGTGTPGGTGTAWFGFDSGNTNTTYGQTIATKAAGTFSTGVLAFVGNISNTTEAGIYTTTLNFIATGTY